MVKYTKIEQMAHEMSLTLTTKLFLGSLRASRAIKKLFEGRNCMKKYSRSEFSSVDIFANVFPYINSFALIVEIVNCIFLV